MPLGRFSLLLQSLFMVGLSSVGGLFLENIIFKDWETIHRVRLRLLGSEVGELPSMASSASFIDRSSSSSDVSS